MKRRKKSARKCKPPSESLEVALAYVTTEREREREREREKKKEKKKSERILYVNPSYYNRNFLLLYMRSSTTSTADKVTRLAMLD